MQQNIITQWEKKKKISEIIKSALKKLSPALLPPTAVAWRVPTARGVRGPSTELLLAPLP